MTGNKQDEFDRLCERARTIIESKPSTTDFKVPPWDLSKIKMARDWYGQNPRVTNVIANYLKIKE